ncbi:hypothetical protein OCK74_03645 [Chitinophagaceae bacterium LB-8]|uniref:Uncharacterized protein n=1 Tax=Paraflavisolibacter caeni TaxID=2982496 RepID=A0A9X2XNH0_9BACT|nr:hypothetical protein [Paraflavisolibacter caeni]MCU7548189.1 hypothetical protein [Paraflavisolibacter caeni]
MKKLFVFILALIYLSEASGMGLHFHYCMGKLVSWDLTGTDKKCAAGHNSKDCTGEIKSKDCCKDELKTANLDIASNTEQALFIKLFPVKLNLLFSYLPTAHITVYTTVRANSINAPLGKYGVPIFIFNNVFRI